MATTKATIWLKHNPRKPIDWLGNHKRTIDGFGEVFSTTKDVPLLSTGDEDNIAKTHQDTSVDRKRTRYSREIVAVKSQTDPSRRYLEEKLKSMNEELRLIRKATHFHVVEAVGSYMCQDKVAFLMSPCADCNLKQVLGLFETNDDLRKKMEEAWGTKLQHFVPSVMGCLAHALSYIHSINIKHKDIKPENILFDKTRVVIADFGISRGFETGSTSDGPTARTKMYASPETLDSNKRGRSQDIYSLACVFIEMFAVYKGFSADKVHTLFETKKEVENANANTYASNMPDVLNWLSEKVIERCDIQVLDLIRKMVRIERKERLLANEVWEELVTLRSDLYTKIHFCGACCMPQNPSLEGLLDMTAPTPANYDYENPLLSKATEEASEDPRFKTRYAATEMSPYTWIRNLRVGHGFITDSVEHSERDHYLIRKSIWTRDIDDSDKKKEERREIKQAALAEAKLLKKLVHRHIVRLKSTYRHGDDTFVILMDPVTKINLSQYLSLVEIKRTENLVIADWETFLRISPGCLANAVVFLHDENIVHGDIESRNILVAPEAGQKIKLADFGIAALKQRERDMIKTYYGPDHDEARHVNDNPYASPNIHTFEMTRPSDDIFALGCIFIEMETVRLGRTLQEMREFLAKSQESQNNVSQSEEAKNKKIQSKSTGNRKRLPQMQYRNPDVLPELPKWIEQLHPQGTDYFDLVSSMVFENQAQRPSATEVLGGIANCKTESNLPMCGKQCMPSKIEHRQKSLVELPH